jgi:hypothetical protein
LEEIGIVIADACMAQQMSSGRQPLPDHARGFVWAVDECCSALARGIGDYSRVAARLVNML